MIHKKPRPFDEINFGNMEDRAGGGTRHCPSLFNICMRQAARILLDLSDKLHVIPIELAEVFLTDHLGRGDNPRLLELEVMAEAFWNPKRICLTGVIGLNSRGLQHLSYASNLLKLDLSGCSWLDSLNCLPGLSKLECLDVENVYSITDSLAAHFIQGMTSLYALNLSGTGVADGFVEALTYGCRLQSWDTSRRFGGATGLMMAGYTTSQGVSSFSNSWSASYDHLHQQWPPLQIKYLRLQRTMVSQGAIQQLLALKDIMLLDVRSLNITKRSLEPFQAKYGLVALPNDCRLLARSNSLLVATLRLICGCVSISETQNSLHQLSRAKVDLIAQFEHRGFTQLLREASRIQVDLSA